MTSHPAWTLCGLAWCVTLLSQQGVVAATRRKISLAEYRDKVYASWLGQCAGNIYGLAHEQKYFHEPGPDRFPLGYSGWGAHRMKALNGAFSDDDTDIEYMYLIAMEKHGVEPTYEQLAEFWRRHVRKDVWLANRAAVAAMNYGLTPPWTGMKPVNPHWFQIDPQLVNEIWAVTAPGMVRYAAAKSAWAARIMSDGWAIEPTVHYGAMYAAAFFEKDIETLIQIGKAALPPGARFAQTVDDMIALHRKHPGDWKAARKESLQKLYFQEPESTRTATNANLNGAFGILALLYGGGDFQRTLDISCALGFDADNQAATLSGLLGIVHGTKGIPRDLLFPFPEKHWTEPLNDRYSNVTREGLPDASLKAIAHRIAMQGEKVIMSHGGRRVADVDGDSYEIDGEAEFQPPFEFPVGPMPVIESGKPVSYEFLAIGAVAAPAVKRGGCLGRSQRAHGVSRGVAVSSEPRPSGSGGGWTISNSGLPTPSTTPDGPHHPRPDRKGELALLPCASNSPPHWRLAKGRLPAGLELKDGRISGTATCRPAVYPLTVEVRSGSNARRREIQLIVRGENLARKATGILAPVQRADLSLRKLLIIDTPPTVFSESVEVIRDGRRGGAGATFMSIGAGSTPRTDAYGYEWAEPQNIGLVSFSTGFIEEASGWFAGLTVEYRDPGGAWRPVNHLRITPSFPDGDSPVVKAHFAEYLLFFDPVKTRAVRIAGNVGVARSLVKNPPLFTSISELGAYGPVLGRSLLH
ncbi:MAG: ADP-ribosylglycohydrolase family protein [Bryobacteraceae bacterium]